MSMNEKPWPMVCDEVEFIGYRYSPPTEESWVLPVKEIRIKGVVEAVFENGDVLHVAVTEQDVPGVHTGDVHVLKRHNVLKPL